jgi:hypothetical protein
MTRETIAQGRQDLTSSSRSTATNDDWAMMDDADLPAHLVALKGSQPVRRPILDSLRIPGHVSADHTECPQSGKADRRTGQPKTAGSRSEQAYACALVSPMEIVPDRRTSAAASRWIDARSPARLGKDE